jgi:5'(3')-deoxyribonucleotidase
MMPSQSKIIVYVDMDDTLCDFKGAFHSYRQTYPDIQFPQSVPNFFRELLPLTDAVETFQWMSSQPQFEVFILTAPSVKNPLCYTEKRLWIEAYLGFDATRRLVIFGHKHLHKGHFLIDDQVTGRGQDRFEGTLIQFGSVEFPNWRSV